MAQPSEFPQVNARWSGPGDVGDLPAYRLGTASVSRWELSAEEFAEVLSTGVVWLHVWGQHPAVCVSGVSPFVPEPTGG